jgi:MFS transporter, UMF1 family
MTKHEVRMVIAWSLFNFATSIFAINIISLYFPLWLTVDKNVADIVYSLTFSSSMLFAAVCSPIIGYFLDLWHKHNVFLLIFIGICAMSTFALGISNNLVLGLVLFGIANFCYQLVDVLINTLIPRMSTSANVGRFIGYGTGFGYLGIIIGVWSVKPFVLTFGNHAAFIPTALLFVAFLVPCFLLTKGKYVVTHVTTLQTEAVKPWQAFHKIQLYPDFAKFLLAIFVAFIAINTVFVFMSIYLQKVVHFTGEEFTIFYTLSSIFAVIGGFVAGILVDYFGAHKILIGALLLWIINLFVAVVFCIKMMFWFIGPVIGVALGVTWVSSRALVLNFAPKNCVGEFYGLYGMAIKLSAIIGPLLWGTSVWLFGGFGVYKYHVTVCIFIVHLIISVAMLRIKKSITNSI